MYILFDPFTYHVLIPLEVISLAYRVAIDAIAKCLQHFAEDQQ